AGGDEVLDEGVILRDLGQVAVSEQIGTGVADVDHGELVPRAQDRDARGAEAGELRVRLGAGHQLVVRVVDGGAQQIEEVVRPVGVVELSQVGDGHRGGDVTAGRATHAVREDEQVRSG